MKKKKLKIKFIVDKSKTITETLNDWMKLHNDVIEKTIITEESENEINDKKIIK